MKIKTKQSKSSVLDKVERICKITGAIVSALKILYDLVKDFLEQLE